MDLRAILASGQSRVNTDRIVRFVGADKGRLKELMQIFRTGPGEITQRAAWPLSVIAEGHPALFAPHCGTLIGALTDEGHHPAVARNILRIFQETEIQEKYVARLYDICITFITSEMHPIAVRAFAITVASRICERYPELKAELRVILEEMLSIPQSAAIGVRIKRALKAM